MGHSEPTLSPLSRRSSPLAERLRLLLYSVEVRCKTAVVAVARLFLKVAVLLQILDGALDSGAGEAEVIGDALDPRPALALGRGHALEVYIDRLGPVRQAVVSVDGIEVADAITPLCLDTGAGTLCRSPFRRLRGLASLLRRVLLADRVHQLLPPGIVDLRLLSRGDFIRFLEGDAPIQKQL